MSYLRRAIEGNRDRYLATVKASGILRRLRDRADFKEMMADAMFPRNPFEPASPLGGETANPPLGAKNQGDALLAAGRTLEAIPLLASASASNPEDTTLLLKVAALQAWFGLDAEYAVTCRRALELARDTQEPTTADRAAKLCSLRPSGDKAQRDATLALARRGVELGKDHALLNYFQMSLGMAEYRSGNDRAADQALSDAMAGSIGHRHIDPSSAFYRAMSLFRQGKEAEARQLATEAISRMNPPPADEKNPLAGGVNADDIILWMACKEARALLKLEAPPASPDKPRP